MAQQVKSEFLSVASWIIFNHSKKFEKIIQDLYALMSKMYAQDLKL